MIRLNKYFLAVLLAVPGLMARAQGTDNDPESDFQTRTSVEIDKKISKGFHVSAAYELRTEDYLQGIDRHQLTLGTSYKFNDYLKGGLSYSFIERQDASAGWQPRHRVRLFLTGGYTVGDWRFSLKETLQLTHKTGDLNAFQEVRNPLMLKSRLQVQYKGFADVEPYAYAEMRHVFNDPACSATWSTSSQAYSDYKFLGYTDSYVNRWRGGLGLEWKISKQHALDFYGMFDFCRDKDIDTNKAGTKLKSLTYDRTLRTTVGIGYTFSF